MSLDSEFGFIAEWRRREFPEQTTWGAWCKMSDEWDELMDHDLGTRSELEELSDLFITLVNYADITHGLAAFDAAIRDKMRVNMERTWATDEHGKGQHVD